MSMINAKKAYSSNTLSMIIIILVCQILSSLTSTVTAQPTFTSRVCQDTFGVYDATSTFKRNLDELLSSITSNNHITYGFYNFSAGHGLDTVHGIGLCRPDLLVSDCLRCLSDGAAEIIQQCPNQKDAIGWYERCMIRYTDRYIFGKMEFGPWYNLNTSEFSQDQEGFNQTASTLLNKLKKKAASGDSRYKFAAGEANITSSVTTIYALVQCTPDLEEFDCYDCLDNAIDYSLYSSDVVANYVFYTSCNIRYENFLFYNDTNLISLELPPSPPSFTTRTKAITHHASAIAISVAGLTTFIIIAIICILLKMKSAKSPTNFKKHEFDSTLQSLQFKFGTIKQATGEFSHDNMLGQGGYGVVYKGRLPDGQEVAVKRLLKKSRQGDEQFKNEIQTLAKLDHRNLVRLLGFCLEEEEILLIYELVPNRSLDRFIFDSVERASLTWNMLYGIINGIARGLLYLHQDSRLRLIHRDLKAGNVLLDANFNPKIADFGMARLFNIDHTQSVASKIVGTYGYMAPEYALRGYVSMKSDVYSFGVMILEIISGQRISSFLNEDTSEGLLSYAWRNWQEGTPWKFVDAALSSDGFSSQILQCTHIGLLCVQHNPANRPAMSLVTLMLSSSHSLPVPSPPGFYSPGNIQPSLSLLEHTSDQSINTLVTYSENKASITELDPR